MADANRGFLTLIALVAFAIIVALAQVGGPAQGRLEQRDDVRMSDLQAIRAQISCLREVRDAPLPDALGPTDVCTEALRFEDPFSNVPYKYERLDGDRYLLCAAFEDPERISQQAEPMLGRFEEGCFLVTSRERGLRSLPREFFDY